MTGLVSSDVVISNEQVEVLSHSSVTVMFTVFVLPQTILMVPSKSVVTD